MRAGLTLKQVAEKLDVAESTVHGWEHGTNTPHPSHLKKLAELFDVIDEEPKGAPNTFWFRVQMYQYKTVNKETHEQEARQLLQEIYRYSFVKDVQMVSDVGLINLIGAGIQEAFKDTADGEEGGAEA